LAIFASSTLFGWSRREPHRSEEIIRVPELDRTGITLSENMPQHDGQPSDGDQRDGDNRQIEPAHSFCIQLRPTRLLLNCRCTLCRTNQSIGFHVPLLFRPEKKLTRYQQARPVQFLFPALTRCVRIRMIVTRDEIIGSIHREKSGGFKISLR
jgi:hypothetical protein